MPINRRTFLSQAAMIAAGAAALPSYGRSISKLIHTESPTIKRALKFGMIDLQGTVLEKFKLAKDCGFDGIEMDSPSNWDLQEVLDAKDATGLPIHGVVLSTHWQSPFNSPDESTREFANKSLDHALHDCKKLGGSTVLVVPAVVNSSMDYSEAYERSHEEISKHVWTAESLGVSIAFENVWNNFLLSPREAAQYVDEFVSENVGWYFDIGNIVNTGYPAHWIRALGHRIKKLDVKDFSRSRRDNEGLWKGFGVEIGAGDSEWESVCEALKSINYQGWATAEVGGGGKDRLMEISKRMTDVFKPLNG